METTNKNIQFNVGDIYYFHDPSHYLTNCQLKVRYILKGNHQPYLVDKHLDEYVSVFAFPENNVYYFDVLGIMKLKGLKIQRVRK